MNTPIVEASEAEWDGFVAKAHSPETRERLEKGAIRVTRNGVTYRAPSSVVTRGGAVQGHMTGQPVATFDAVHVAVTGAPAAQLGGQEVKDHDGLLASTTTDDLEASIQRELSAGDDELRQQIQRDLSETGNDSAFRGAARQTSHYAHGGDELEASLQRSLRGDR